LLENKEIKCKKIKERKKTTEGTKLSKGQNFEGTFSEGTEKRERRKE